MAGSTDGHQNGRSVNSEYSTSLNDEITEPSPQRLFFFVSLLKWLVIFALDIVGFQPEYRCLRQLSDFNNVFKAFIGTSYLSFPFGFLQSGLLLGCIVLTVVVFVTGHCCHLIIDVKKYILRQRCGIQDPEEAEEDPEYQRLAHRLRFNDIGQICLGRFGPYIVDFFLVFTQTGFCIAYFIFIGTAIHGIVPLKQVPSNQTELALWSDIDIPGARNLPNVTGERNANGMVFSDMNIPTAAWLLENISDTIVGNTTDMDINVTSTMPVITTEATVSPTDFVPFLNISDFVYMSVMPDLKYLVLAPLLPFILFGLIRDMRHMGPWSLLANLAIIAGYLTILSLMLIGFEINPDVKYFNWAKAPVFFGQVSCAFEGIGLVLPVEASMRDNAHNFAAYMNSTLIMVSTILASFGIIGYLRFGPTVQQVITMNIPSDGIVPFALACTLILAVTLTFPLQVFPVLEILERYVLGVGKQDVTLENRGSSAGLEVEIEDRTNDSMTDGAIDGDDSNPDDEYDEEEQGLLGSQVRDRKKTHPVADWKRNILRSVIILFIAGLAVLLRDNFAYVGALIGAMGSTALGYVLPCVFHLQLEHSSLPWYVILKDVVIILFGVVGGAMGVVIVLQDIIASFS